jgi:hypothetical protein
MAELSVKVPIRFSEKAQKDLYETCMAYKELAEVRGADNEKLRELVRDMFTTISWCDLDCYPSDNKKREYADRMRELGVELYDSV